MSSPDILVIGGGIAGLSAAALLSKRARVTALEAEEQVGFHSSGRSATMLHYALGNPAVRELTLASRSFFDNPPDGFDKAALAHRLPILVHGRESERAELDALEAELCRFAPHERLEAYGLKQICPLLKIGPGEAEHGIVDHDSLKLDGSALLDGFVRMFRGHGGQLQTNERIAKIEKVSGGWRVTSERGSSYTAPVLVNAAGAWADVVAVMAGVMPIGLEPKRRTIITFDAPAGVDRTNLPFTKTIGDELYFGTESGRLFASPMDEAPSDPCDAQADEYEVALAAYRMEERTIVKVERIHSRWAGLRSFAPDRVPVAGFAPDAEGFFWLAGQGGFGLQTSPAMAAIAASLIAGEPWPVPAVAREELSPGRFLRQPA